MRGPPVGWWAGRRQGGRGFCVCCRASAGGGQFGKLSKSRIDAGGAGSGGRCPRRCRWRAGPGLRQVGRARGAGFADIMTLTASGQQNRRESFPSLPVVASSCWRWWRWRLGALQAWGRSSADLGRGGRWECGRLCWGRWRQGLKLGRRCGRRGWVACSGWGVIGPLWAAGVAGDGAGAWPSVCLSPSLRLPLRGVGRPLGLVLGRLLCSSAALRGERARGVAGPLLFVKINKLCPKNAAL